MELCEERETELFRKYLSLIAALLTLRHVPHKTCWLETTRIFHSISKFRLPHSGAQPPLWFLISSFFWSWKNKHLCKPFFIFMQKDVWRRNKFFGVFCTVPSLLILPLSQFFRGAKHFFHKHEEQRCPKKIKEYFYAVLKALIWISQMCKHLGSDSLEFWGALKYGVAQRSSKCARKQPRSAFQTCLLGKELFLMRNEWCSRRK